MTSVSQKAADRANARQSIGRASPQATGETRRHICARDYAANCPPLSALIHLKRRREISPKIPKAVCWQILWKAIGVFTNFPREKIIRT